MQFTINKKSGDDGGDAAVFCFRCWIVVYDVVVAAADDDNC